MIIDHSKNVATPEDSEFKGFSDSESSETANHDRFIINDPLATLLESFNKISSIISGEYREYIFRRQKHSIIKLKISWEHERIKMIVINIFILQ